MICLHHIDADGYAAAAIVYRAMNEEIAYQHITHTGEVDHEELVKPRKFVRFYPIDYKDPIPFDEIHYDEEVIIVDFSLQRPGEWEKLLNITKNVIWIDHHEKAIEKCPSELAGQMKGIRATNRCGAFLTWKYFHETISTVPFPILMIDKWDRFVHNDDPQIINFIAGLEVATGMDDVRSNLWKTLLTYIPWNSLPIDNSTDELIRRLIDTGEVIRRADSVRNAQWVSKDSYEMEFDGYRAIVLHSNKSNSKVFDSVWAQGKYDIYIIASYHGDGWTVHIYSEPEGPKVNDIAAKYGGGGHPHAGGFPCKELPWSLIRETRRCV